MSPPEFQRALRWTTGDQEVWRYKLSGYPPANKPELEKLIGPPGGWEATMTIQRLAFQRGPEAAWLFARDR